jgi:hypothetical protein
VADINWKVLGTISDENKCHKCGGHKLGVTCTKDIKKKFFQTNLVKLRIKWYRYIMQG